MFDGALGCLVINDRNRIVLLCQRGHPGLTLIMTGEFFGSKNVLPPCEFHKILNRLKLADLEESLVSREAMIRHFL